MPTSLRISALVAIAILIPLLMWKPAPGYADGPPTYECRDNAKLARLSAPLARMQRLLAAGRPVTIMALGSSSTAGAGASAPSASYPSRLETELRTRFSRLTITVTNRGVNGEEVGDMLARFGQAVADDKPDVVLWQVGTNAVLTGYEHGKPDSVIRDGISRIKAIGADVVLIDPQYAPKVISQPEIQDMIDLISSAAAQEKVDVFHRFALMRHWHERQGIPFQTFLSSDGLHMNDWGHSCFAKGLAEAIAEAAAPKPPNGNENSRLDSSAAEATTGEAH